MKRLAVIACAILFISVACFADEDSGDGGTDVAVSTAPPLRAYPGSRFSKKLADQYLDERGVDKSWAYSVHADFSAVRDFFKKQIGEPTAESESDDLYFATKNTVELRITRAAKGWVTVELGTTAAAASTKEAAPANPPKEGSSSNSDSDRGERPPRSAPTSPFAPKAPEPEHFGRDSGQ